MKTLPRLALAACLAPTTAFATNIVDIDVYRELIEFRIGKVGAQRALDYTHGRFMNDLLVDPTSPYSKVVDEPGITNMIWWPEFTSRLSADRPLGYDEPLEILRWDLGLTKARTGIEVLALAQDGGRGYGNPAADASARKVDVDDDIYWQVIDMTGNSHSTLAAGYAVALQLLRRQVATTPVADHARLAIRPAVLERFMAATSPDDIAEYDLHYLSNLLRGAMSTWAPGGATASGQRQLPVVYRVARVAAAYRDNQGYLNGGTCLADGTANPSTAGTGLNDDDRPLCFTAATDRAVHRWYRRELRQQMSGVLPNQHTHNGTTSFLAILFDTLALMDLIGFVEVSEAAIASDLAGDGSIQAGDAEFAAERAERLVCGVNA